MGSSSLRKAYIESTRRGIFGTTAVRIQPITQKDQTEVPGPAQYQIKEKPFQSRYQQLSSTFASLSNRLVEPPSIVKVKFNPTINENIYTGSSLTLLGDAIDAWLIHFLCHHF